MNCPDIAPQRLPMYLEFAGRTVLVTGAARGIGRCIAYSFAEAGARVGIIDCNESSAIEVVLELQSRGFDARPFIADLALPGEARRVVDQAASHFGRLDVLVNNARAGLRLKVHEECESNWDITIDVGFRAAHFASLAAVPIMHASGGGSIVNISSTASQYVSAESAGYHAAKAGLTQLTRYLAAHCGAMKVRVNAVLPGFIVQEEHRERFNSSDNFVYRSKAAQCHPVGRVGSSGDVANCVLFLSSVAAGFITGQAVVVDGGLNLRDAWSVLNP